MKRQNEIDHNLKKLEVVVVLPVFSSCISFLSAINDHCNELVENMPEVNWTILIINDGSLMVPSENNLFQKLSASVNYHYYHYNTNFGKGYAVRFGLHKAAEADIFIYTDYDFPFGTKAVLNAVNILRQNEADIVAADRGLHYLSYLPFPRKIITRLTRNINSNVLKLYFNDTQAGLKGMNNRSVPVMLQTSLNGFLFDLQFIRSAEQQQLRIHALPVECTKNLQLKNFRISVIFKEIKNLIMLIFQNKAKKSTQSYYSGFERLRYSTATWTNKIEVNTGKRRLAQMGAPQASAIKSKN